MKKLFSLLFMLLVSVVTFSQTNLSQEEFNKLPIETQNQIKNVKAVSQTQENLEIAGKWVGFGKEVGTAVNESLKAVTQTAVDFSNTKLGKITILLVIYKVIGEDIIQALFGVLWLILVFTVAGFIYFNYGKNKRVLKSEKYDPEAKKVLKEYTISKAYKYFSNVIYFRVSTEAEHEKMYRYTTAEYESDLKKLLAFDINNLWDKKFWGLKVSDSICAVATEPAELLSTIKKCYREQI